ncbi:MAG: GNAT family N-acetyltransferase [Pseudomonadota bacterium]|uniref:GNAT family N-acetyltransferase n=1 Tax=Roseovarius salincola TaxID=2978479 RepID=UPI0022A74068|nr:GNAT family N-acyltransferase [Roseovarius sp. EGI FJ00037]MCZ0810979.1 GNAT family N-acetyltransferase [Roseovarius sp. EGI FJ00037]
MDSAHAPQFRVKLASSEDDLRAAQRLRYRVFVEELGGDGPLVDHDARLERDRFDQWFDHLILIDDARGGDVVGVYRVLRDDQAQRAGQFYSEDEYDIDILKRSGRRLLELGRSCLDMDYRGGAAMYHLWTALADYVSRHGIEILFGVASFHGTDTQELAQPLSLLHHRHLAPPPLRVRAQPAHFASMDLVPEADLDRRAAMLKVPALIKAYLRLGGHVGEGAFVDHDFNTTDICLVMDAERMSERKKSIYTKGVTG